MDDGPPRCAAVPMGLNEVFGPPRLKPDDVPGTAKSILKYTENLINPIQKLEKLKHLLGVKIVQMILF